MKNFLYKLLTFLIIILISIFVGYENPKLVEVPKKYVKSLLEKATFNNNLSTEKKDQNLNISENKKNEIISNSFSLEISKVKSYPDKTASLTIEQNGDELIFEIFTHTGLFIKKNNISKVNLPSSFYKEKEYDGGLKSVFLIQDQYFGLISQKKLSCLYASLVNLKNGKEILTTPCLPDKNKVNFGGLGGAYIKMENKILLSVGVPTHISDEIDKFSQKKESIFGKIISIENKEFFKNENNNLKYNIFSLGHRNPQGMVLLKNSIFSLEHGPQGGDELNEIIEGKNYGWPIVSLGTRYDGGKSFSRGHKDSKFKEPIFTFLPAVAPSSLNLCPKNLSKYYENYNCLLGLSLRGMSILIFLLDKNETRVINVEKIMLKKRLRHFGLDKSGKIFFDENDNFYITSDNDGIYKVKFKKFR